MLRHAALRLRPPPLFFDLLPLRIKLGDTHTIRLRLFTVPARAVHSTTRRIILREADGVIFVADSQVNQTDANKAAFTDLQRNLTELNEATNTPLVIQFNKQDLPFVRTKLEIRPPKGFEAKSFEDFMQLGMIITSMPAINAIPHLCQDKIPGIRGYADLPLLTSAGLVSR